MSRDRSGRTLSACVVVALVFWVGSNALLERSAWFWRAALAGDQGRALHYPLTVEARLALRRAQSARLVVLGSSVAQADVGWRRVATRWRLARGELVVVAVPGGQGFELAQLAPTLADLEPRRVLLFVTPWLLHDEVDWQGTRFYHPRVAFDALGWRRSLARHDLHAAGLLAASHVVLRRRDALRDQLFGEARYRAKDRAAAARRQRRAEARPEQFSCANPHLDALAVAAEIFDRGGAEVWLVPVPVADRRLPADAEARLEHCLADFAARHGVERLRRTELPAMRPADFADPVHLNAAGRRRFTSALLELLPAPPTG